MNNAMGMEISRKMVSEAATDNHTKRHTSPKRSSNRSFGFVFAVVFAIVALWPLWRGAPVHVWAFAASGVFALLAIVAPVLLAYPNRAWLAFGDLLHKIMSPVALGLIYFGAILPTGLLMRLAGKDLLSLRLKPGESSYWVERKPPGPPSESLKNQF